MTKQSSTGLFPSLRAIPFMASRTGGGVTRMLSDKQRHELSTLATRVAVTPRGIVYREASPATAVYICSEGAFKSFRDLPSGRRRVAAFLFTDDLFGLAQNGKYVNTVQAITRAACYRIPMEALAAVLRRDAELEFHFLCKVTHELREAHRRSIIIGRRSATGRIAMFLSMLETNNAPDATADLIALPMSRSDIANYVGLSPEAMSRATGQLTKQGILKFDGPHAVRVIDRHRFRGLAADI
jgi:CRP-like cAMP-binding protein